MEKVFPLLLEYGNDELDLMGSISSGLVRSLKPLDGLLKCFRGVLEIFSWAIEKKKEAVEGQLVVYGELLCGLIFCRMALVKSEDWK